MILGGPSPGRMQDLRGIRGTGFLLLPSGFLKCSRRTRLAAGTNCGAAAAYISAIFFYYTTHRILAPQAVKPLRKQWRYTFFSPFWVCEWWNLFRHGNLWDKNSTSSGALYFKRFPFEVSMSVHYPWRIIHVLKIPKWISMYLCCSHEPWTALRVFLNEWISRHGY